MRESNQVGSRCREHTLLENRILLYKTGAAILGIEFVARENFGTSVLKLIGLKLSIPVALSRLRLSWFISHCICYYFDESFKAIYSYISILFWGFDP